MMIVLKQMLLRDFFIFRKLLCKRTVGRASCPKGGKRKASKSAFRKEKKERRTWTLLM